MPNRLPKRIPGTYSAHLPIPGEVNASGLWSDKETEQWQRKARDVEAAYRHYRKLGQNFFQSYQAGDPLRAIHLRDFAVAQAIAHSLVVCQYRTEQFRELTPFAHAYWKRHGFSQFWNKNKAYRDYYYGGYLGSLAYSLFRQGPKSANTDPIALIKDQQEAFWRTLDLQDVALENKYSQFLERMQLDLDKAQRVAGILTGLYDLAFGQPNHDLKQKLLAGGVLRGEVANLPWRITHIQVKPELVAVAEVASQRNLIPVGPDWLPRMLARFIRVAPPGGIDSLYQGLAVEAYLKIAELIDNDAEKYDALAEWERRLPSRRLEELFAYFALIYDALRQSEAVFTLDPSRDYIERLIGYYQGLRDDPQQDAFLRLTGDPLPNPNATVKPLKGKPRIILSGNAVTRGQLALSTQSLDRELTVFISDLSGQIDPFSVAVYDTQSVIEQAVEFAEPLRLVATPEPIDNDSELDRLDFHSNVIEVTYVDQRPPYQP